MQGPQVFISYSHRDKKWLDLLQTHLAPLLQNGAITVWADTQIRPGQEWKTEIETAMASARVAVLLVTPDFLASDFIQKNELPPLLEAAQAKGLNIFWVAVIACLYDEARFAKYQAANDPSKPLKSLSIAKRDPELVQIARQIKQAVQESSSTAPKKDSSLVVPDERNPAFTGRAEALESLRAKLADNSAAALLQTEPISGLGGIGKTQTALEYAKEDSLLPDPDAHFQRHNMEFFKELRGKIGDPAYVLLLLGFVSITFAARLSDGTPKQICTDIALAFLFLGLLLSVLSLLKNKLTIGLAMGFFDGLAAGCIASVFVGVCHCLLGLDASFILAWVLVVTPTGAALGVLLTLFRPETGIAWREQVAVWLSLCFLILAAAIGLAWSLNNVVSPHLPNSTQLSHLLWLVNSYFVVLFVLGGIRLNWNANRWKRSGALVLPLLTISTVALYLAPQQVRRWEFATKDYPVFDATIATALLWIATVFIAASMGSRKERSRSEANAVLQHH